MDLCGKSRLAEPPFGATYHAWDMIANGAPIGSFWSLIAP